MQDDLMRELVISWGWAICATVLFTILLALFVRSALRSGAVQRRRQERQAETVRLLFSVANAALDVVRGPEDGARMVNLRQRVDALGNHLMTAEE